MRRLVFAALLIACSDHPNQLIVTFDTDAPIGAASRVDPLDGPAPLFDRLRIDVLQPDGTVCNGCSNDFAVTSDQFTARTVSIGVPLQSASGWTLRARLYVARFSSDGSPNPDSTIDARVSLPDASNNPGTAGVFLATDTAGVVSDAPGALGDAVTASAVGTWAGAQRVGCDETGLPRPPKTACVAGGAYWMGMQDAQSIAGRSPTWHRLAVMSPHYIDVAEVTVGAFRAKNMQATITNLPSDTGGPAYCTFTDSPGAYEKLPVNCVTINLARSYCTKVGGQLPTAAQFERLATRFGRARYVWGLDQPTCDDAVFANCATVDCYTMNSGADPCFHLPSPSPVKDDTGSSIGGPVAAPDCTPDAPCTLRDAITVGDAVVVNLAANVAELTSDKAFAEDDACYDGHVLDDPACPSKGTAQVRGGTFSTTSFSSLRGDTLINVPVDAYAPDIGFRCAYPATPAQ